MRHSLNQETGPLVAPPPCKGTQSVIGGEEHVTCSSRSALPVAMPVEGGQQMPEVVGNAAMTTKNDQGATGGASAAAAQVTAQGGGRTSARQATGPDLPHGSRL